MNKLMAQQQVPVRPGVLLALALASGAGFKWG